MSAQLYLPQTPAKTKQISDENVDWTIIIAQDVTLSVTARLTALALVECGTEYPTGIAPLEVIENRLSPGAAKAGVDELIRRGYLGEEQIASIETTDEQPTKCPSCKMNNPGFSDSNADDQAVQCDGCGHRSTWSVWVAAAKATDMAPASFNFGDHEVRVSVDEDNGVWWVLTDVCKALDLTNPSKSAERLNDDEKTTLTISDSGGRPYKQLIINEPGLYRLIFTSRKKEAEAFKHWVFHEVLPTIRKTGGYQTQAEKPVAEIETEVVTKYEIKEVEFESGFTTHFLLDPEKMIWLKSPNESYRKNFAKSLRRVLLDRSDLSEIQINRELKDFVFNRPRGEWTTAHYLLATVYLRNVYGL